MSVLSGFMRPVEKFDANLKKHREYYAEYLKTDSWGSCPFQLQAPNSIVSLSTYAREQLIEFYIKKEFGK